MFHGKEHADAVYNNGMQLASATSGAKRHVIAEFAYLHDRFRRNEDDDPDHGLRAAAHVRNTEHLVLSMGADLELLCYALEFHDKGFTSIDPTIGCCWDADRLELPRVGITPDPRLMSTQEGKRRAADLRRSNPPLCRRAGDRGREGRRRLAENLLRRTDVDPR